MQWRKRPQALSCDWFPATTHLASDGFWYDECLCLRLCGNYGSHLLRSRFFFGWIESGDTYNYAWYRGTCNHMCLFFLREGALHEPKRRYPPQRQGLPFVRLHETFILTCCLGGGGEVPLLLPISFGVPSMTDLAIWTSFTACLLLAVGHGSKR